MRNVLVPLLLAVAVAACTKVIEQPQAAQAPPPPDPLRTGTSDPAAQKPQVVQKSWGPLDRERSGPKLITNSNRLPDTLNGDPQGLSREQVNTAIQAVLPTLAGCFANANVSSATVSFDADPSGMARGIAIRGVPPDTEACVRGIFGALQLPRFKGNPVPIDYPLSIHSTVVQKQAPAAPPAAPPPAPSPSEPPSSTINPSALNPTLPGAPIAAPAPSGPPATTVQPGTAQPPAFVNP